MKITVYELLGMVIDGKAPKEIRYNNDIYVYVEKYGDYRSEKTLLYLLDKIIRDNDYNNVLALNNKVEILEELKEKKIPEKLSTWFSVETKQSRELNIEYANTNFENMYEKINEICDYIKTKGE